MSGVRGGGTSAGRRPAPDRDDHLMTIALTASLQRRAVRPPLDAGSYWALVDDLGGRVASAASDAPDADVRALADRGALAALHQTELEQQGLGLLTPFHAGYPVGLRDLGDAAPPLLYVAGAADRLVAGAGRRVAILPVGGPAAGTGGDDPEVAVAAARAAADAAVAAGWDVVSGATPGIEAQALNAAVAGGAFVVAVLTDGLRLALRSAARRRLVTSGRGLLVSTTPPDVAADAGGAAAAGARAIAGALADRVHLVRAGGEGLVLPTAPTEPA